MRMMPIIAPGSFLSQPPMASTPSMNWLCAAVSIASAITSRDTSEYFMPSVPMEMPSVTVMVPNICGMAPARRGAGAAAAASGRVAAVPRVIVEGPLAVAAVGFSKTGVPWPIARRIRPLGRRATTLVIVDERNFSVMVRFYVLRMGHAGGARAAVRAVNPSSPTFHGRIPNENPRPSRGPRLHRHRCRGLRRIDRHGADVCRRAGRLGRALRDLRDEASPRHRAAGSDMRDFV